MKGSENLTAYPLNRDNEDDEPELLEIEQNCFTLTEESAQCVTSIVNQNVKGVSSVAVQTPTEMATCPKCNFIRPVSVPPTFNLQIRKELLSTAESSYSNSYGHSEFSSSQFSHSTSPISNVAFDCGENDLDCSAAQQLLMRIYSENLTKVNTTLPINISPLQINNNKVLRESSQNVSQVRSVPIRLSDPSKSSRMGLKVRNRSTTVSLDPIDQERALRDWSRSTPEERVEECSRLIRRVGDELVENYGQDPLANAGSVGMSFIRNISNSFLNLWRTGQTNQENSNIEIDSGTRDNEVQRRKQRDYAATRPHSEILPPRFRAEKLTHVSISSSNGPESPFLRDSDEDS